MTKKLLQHLCYSNVWISLGSTSLCLLYFYLKSFSPSWTFVAFIFCSTVLTYTYQRYQKMLDNERIKGDRMEWMKQHLLFVKFSLICSLIFSAIFALFLKIETISVLALLGLISFLYAYKFKRLKGIKINLRDIPGLKIILIGIVWAGSTVLIVDLEHYQLNFLTLLSFLGISLFIIGITIPFDIRDLHVDESSKKTIPQLIGYQAATFVAVFLILLSAYLIHLGTGFNFWILLAVSGTVSFILLPSKPQKNDLFYSFYVDGILIIYPLLIYLLNSL